MNKEAFNMDRLNGDSKSNTAHLDIEEVRDIFKKLRDDEKAHKRAKKKGHKGKKLKKANQKIKYLKKKLKKKAARSHFWVDIVAMSIPKALDLANSWYNSRVGRQERPCNRDNDND
jgi:hypothetical protein